MENVCLHLHDSDFMVKENTGHITDVSFCLDFISLPVSCHSFFSPLRDNVS